MKSGDAEEVSLGMERVGQPPRMLLPQIPLPGFLEPLKDKAAILLPLTTILALALGILLGAVSEGISSAVNTTADALINGYSYGAPVIIFIVLAPVLSRLLSTRKQGGFGLYVITWLAATKILALLWAVAFTVVVFGFPIVSEGSIGVGGALTQTGKSVLNTLAVSQFFWAIYVAIGVAIIATRVKPIADSLEKGVSGVESLGQFIQPLIPFFMFAIGVYLQALPANLEEEIGLGGSITSLHTVSIMGIGLDPTTTAGMVLTYVIGALLVAVACFVWHFALLAVAKYKEKRFSVKDYFKNYWIKAYPLLWSTSSETIATPLNLYILSRHAPWIHPTVRRLVAGAGSVLCTNGTLISAFLLLGLVGSMLGLEFSMLELLLAIPVAFLISFGIPGIPGELLLFAGPLSLILPIPPETLPVFLALYLGLQIGLPDSFRTGANTTNNYVYCVLLNRVYENRFAGQEPNEVD